MGVNSKFLIAIGLIVVKLLYMLSIDLMLPDFYHFLSFQKDVNWDLMLIEMLPFLIVGLIFITSMGKDVVCDFFLLVLFIMDFIPVNSGLSLSNNNTTYFALNNIYYIVLFYVICRYINREKTNITEALANERLFTTKNKKIIRCTMLILSIIAIFYVYTYNGLNFVVLASEIYDTRAEYSEYMTDHNQSFISYFAILLKAITKWFLPIYLYFAIKNRNKIDIIISLFTFVALFTVDMQKSVLMIILVILFINFVESKLNYKNICYYFLVGIIALFSISLIEYYSYNDSLIFTLIIRRMFYIPTYMCTFYYNFFSMHEKLWFTQDAFLIQNILQDLFGRIYNVDSVQVISQFAFNGELASPNTGMFAEPYAQMGIIGIFVYPFIILFILRKLRNSAECYGPGGILVCTFKLCMTMSSVFILTSSALVSIIVFIMGSNYLKKVLLGK